MRGLAFKRALRGIVASIVPVASLGACGSDVCHGEDGQSEEFLTLDNAGNLISRTNSPPILGDASVIDAAPMDDGGGEAAVPINCSMCQQECSSTTVRGCELIARSADRLWVRCDLDNHRVCVPEDGPMPICGRRPAGLGRPRGRRNGGDPLGTLLAQMASLEAASIPAFETLARELEAHGAPRSLCRAARRAAADEVRHARMMTALARRHGARPAQLRTRPGCIRSLARISVENCVEGCVRETFGAMVAMWQAREAKDPELRRVFRVIARDEARHAALAFRVAGWTATTRPTTEVSRRRGPPASDCRPAPRAGPGAAARARHRRRSSVCD